jgi:glutamate-1-semialdehyde 2,1-aminomutase
MTEVAASLFERAQARIPGGVDSPVRSFSSVGGEPFFVTRGAGATLTDTDGRTYLDYVQSWGASILGHAHPAVVEAVTKAAVDGTSFGAPTEREVELAEAIAARVPSVDKVRLVSSGTEAGMTAVRLARGATGRTKIVKFAGCYHGHTDALLVAAGSGVATLGIPGSAGVTPGTVADTIVIPYNDEGALDEVFATHGADLAAVLVEPVAANMGLVPPADGYLEGLRRRCTDAGALLVCDEVITGFRLGLAGAQGRYGITPDLSMFGKVVGGGLPLAAIGGRADVMDCLAPVGPVYQAGTLSGNPLATAAGLAVLGELSDASYVTLEARAATFAAGLRHAFTDEFAGTGVAAQVTQVGTLTGLFFAPSPVTDYAEAQQADHERYAHFFHAMLDRGVFLAPSGYETLFVSLAHDDETLETTIAAAREAAAAIV